MTLIELVQNFPGTTFLLVAVVVLVIHASANRRVKNFCRRLPGPPRYPLIGSALDLLVPRDDLCRLQFKHAQLYGQRYIIPVGNIYYLIVANAADIEKVLSSSVHVSKGDIYKFIMPWLGEGLLTSQGKKWQRRRKMLTPAFHFKILEDFMVVFNENARTLVEILATEFLTGEAKDIFPYITRCALDIICETAMDRKIDAQRQRDAPYVKAVYEMCELLVYRVFRIWYNYDFLWSLTTKGRECKRCLGVLHGFTEKVIAERKADRENNNNNDDYCPAGPGDDEVFWRAKKRVAFLDLLLDAQSNPENELTDADIREEVDTFMFEGHDTTAASLGWTVFLLASYPEHQAKVIEELDEIFGNDHSRPATAEDLTKMKYLELCIKESLRLYPSVPFIARYLNSDLVLDEETTVPAGVNVVLLGMQIHRNEAVFPEPEVFSPERFLPENSAGRHPFSYIPFSAGPRNCIGQKFAMMEEKVVLSTIFRNFFVEPAERLEDLVVLAEIITRPRDGFKVKLHLLDDTGREKMYSSLAEKRTCSSNNSYSTVLQVEPTE